MTTASIHDLPEETLAEIFYFTQAPFQIEIHRHCYLWTLSRVCTHWQDIVFNTPKLWADITIDLSMVRRSKLQKRSNDWKMCLKRSKNHSLSISVITYDPVLKFLPQLLESSVQEIHRWEHVEFRFPMSLLIPFIPDPIVPYPRLRSLKCMDQLSDPMERLIPLKIELFRDAPLLSKLELTAGVPSPLSLSMFPWSQITEFTISLTGEEVVDYIFNVLRSMPNLVSLKLWDLNIQPNPAPTTGIMRLPHLQSLAWMNGPPNISPFLDSVEAPLLTEIEFSDPREINDKIAASIQHFLQKSKCPLKAVKLVGTQDKSAMALLSLFPDIETLILEVVMTDHEIFRALTFDETKSEWLCPKMKQLVLRKLYLSSWDSGHNLVSMVESRLQVAEEHRDRGCRLESIHVVAQGQSDVESYMRLQEKVSAQHLSSTFIDCAEFYTPLERRGRS